MKYIVFDDGSVILFSDSEDHKKMSAGRPVRSAGFCVFETKRNVFDDIVCGSVGAFGESKSLGITSMPEDTKIIKEAIHFQ